MRLPDGWAEATLADLIARDGVFTDGDWVETKDQDPSGNVRLTQLADVGEGVFRDRSSRFLRPDQADSLNCTFLEPGDVLVARMPDPLGRACLVPELGQPAVTAVDVCIIRPGPGSVDSRWLMWAINSPQFRHAVDGLQSGTTRKRISRKNLASIDLPVPPLGEQRRILAAIEELLSRVAAGEGVMGASLRRIESLRKRVLISSVPDAPTKGWTQATIGEAGSVQLGRQRSPKYHHGPHMRPYLRVANVFEDRIDTSDIMQMNFGPEEFERYRLRDGDILLNEGQTPDLVGRPAIYRGDPPEVGFTNSLLRFVPKSGIHPEYALLVFLRHLHAGRFKREARITTNIAHLSAGRLKAVEFPYPSEEEQVRIVREVDAHLSLISSLRATVESTRKRSAALRRAILERGFRGELVPQDPNDEPASVLLERIRAERRAAAMKPTRPKRVRA